MTQDFTKSLSTLDQIIKIFSSNEAEKERQLNQDIGNKKAKLFENMDSHKQYLTQTLDSLAVFQYSINIIINKYNN